MSSHALIKHITKQDFLNYFKLPRTFWFLQEEEMEDLFTDESLLEEIYDLSLQDHLDLLREMVESPQALLKDNAQKLNKLKDKKLVDYYKSFFNLPYLALYNHAAIQDDLTQMIVEILTDPKRPTVFFYKPTLISDDIKIRPTAIYKFKGKIYLIEHFWSTTLKQEALAHLIFYNNFFVNHLNQKIDQYLFSYLSAEPSPEKQLIINITNSLPFTAKVRRPEGINDPKMKNVNTFFGLEIDYRESLYEKLFTQQEFEGINNEPWEVGDEGLLNPERTIRELLNFKENPDRNTDFYETTNRFLSQKLSIVGPSTPHYKLIFQHHFPTLTFSASLIPLVNTLLLMLSCKTKEKQNRFLNYTSHFNFFSKFPKDQDYVIFMDAVTNYEVLSNKKIKVYYDFETVSLPFPYIENTKPYTQIVLQLSLIVTIYNIEQTPTKNIILDPLEISVNSFKEIIDAIYVNGTDVAYVVYNKSFENTRLKEMAELINEDEYRMKVVEIIDRTIDLANWFTYGNNPRIIHKKLQGFHSIKRVNKLIPKCIEHKTGTKKYSDLKKCQNGVMAQAMLLSRALVTDKSLDKHNWEKNKIFMYSYCENDVRSMIAVELYIHKLLEENKYPPGTPEVFLQDKLKFKRLKFLNDDEVEQGQEGN